MQTFNVGQLVRTYVEETLTDMQAFTKSPGRTLIPE